MRRQRSGDYGAFYRGRRVLVTGHTGFKGSWLVEWLLMLEADVTGLALPPATTPALFDQLGLAARCDHRLGDIRDAGLVRRLVREVRPDVIFHLAAQPLVRRSYEQPMETYATNVMGTVHVLDALRDADWSCAAVMVTTDKVYENRERRHAYRESDPLGGYDPYSSSKACAELAIQAYRRSFFNPVRIQEMLRHPKASRRGPPVAVASARAGNVIGGGDWAEDRIVPDCMRALAGNQPIVVRNPGATRPWQHVLDPLSGYLLLAATLHRSLTARGSRLPACASAFNFGPAKASNRPVSDLVDGVLQRWPGRRKDRSDPNAPHEAGQLSLATEKASRTLGWRPRLAFDAAVDLTVRWYRAAAEGDASVPGKVTREQIQSYMRGGD